MIASLAQPVQASQEQDLPLIGSIDDLVPCTLQAPSGLGRVEARCGWLEVPEDPGRPDGQSIRLHLALVPAVDETIAGSPLAVLAGGPGQSAADFYSARAGAFARIRQEHPILVLDQRGTGDSNRLTCEEPDDIDETEWSPELMREATRDCLDQLKSDPRYYTTSVAVRDLDQARRTLAFDQLNLYGASYGTRVALHYLRRYPGHTRAVILDGVIAGDMIVGPEIAIDAQAALDLAFARCANDENCSETFPDLADDFSRLRDALGENAIAVRMPDPIDGTMHDESLGADELAVALRLLSYAPQSVALIPLLITEAANGNPAPLLAQALMLGGDVSDALATGMHNAVVCTEDMPFYQPDPELEAAIEKTYLGRRQLDGLLAICDVWPAGLIDDDFKQPVKSDVPVLMLSGEADPVTPPRHALRAMASLGNARHLELAGQGHGQLSTGCVPRLMADFIDDPTPSRLDAHCITRTTPDGFFVDFNGPTP